MALAELQAAFDEKLVTQVLRHVAFKISADRFANYHEKNAEGPFCTSYIDPKLKLLRDKYGDWIKDSLTQMARTSKRPGVSETPRS